MRSVLCIHPTNNKCAVVIDNDMELRAAINSSKPSAWQKFESMFNFDGCEVQRGEAQYLRQRIKMTAQEYITLVLSC